MNLKAFHGYCFPLRPMAACWLLAVLAGCGSNSGSGPVVGLSNCQEINFTQIADSSSTLSGFTFPGSNGAALPSINEKGQVSFGATLRAGGQAIFSGDGGFLTTIADTNNGQFTGFQDFTQINNNGVVAFAVALGGSGSGVFTGDGKSVTPIATNGNGFLSFGPPSINSQGLVAFTGRRSSGDFAVSTGSGGGISTLFSSAFPTANAAINDQGTVAFSQSAFLVTSNSSPPQEATGLGNVIQYDVAGIGVPPINTPAIGSLVPPGTAGLKNPTGLAFGPDGNLYIASRDSNSILRFDGNTGSFLGTFVASGSGGLSTPAAITFGSDGNLYVASRRANPLDLTGPSAVLRYNGSTGAFIDVAIAKGTAGLDFPTTVLTGPDQALYVSSLFSGSVLRYDLASRQITTFIPRGSGGLSNPQGLAFGPDSNLYVADFNATDPTKSSILKFEGKTGSPLGTFATELPGVNGISFGPDQNLYVATFGGVFRFNGANGSALPPLGITGNGGLESATEILSPLFRVLTTTGGSTATRIADISSGFAPDPSQPNFRIPFPPAPAIDESGTVAYYAGVSGNNGIFSRKGNNGSVTTVGDTNSSFSNFFPVPAITRNGFVAFFSEVRGGQPGIFLSSSPGSIRKVIQVGDKIFGRSVAFVSLSRNGVNSVGQTAFYVIFTSGTTAIYRANPARCSP